jgi:hypothetical protein
MVSRSHIPLLDKATTSVNLVRIVLMDYIQYKLTLNNVMTRKMINYSKYFMIHYLSNQNDTSHHVLHHGSSLNICGTSNLLWLHPCLSMTGWYPHFSYMKTTRENILHFSEYLCIILITFVSPHDLIMHFLSKPKKTATIEKYKWLFFFSPSPLRRR